MASDYGSDLLPFGLSRALDEATDSRRVELYDAFRDDLRERFDAGRRRAAVWSKANGS